MVLRDDTSRDAARRYAELESEMASGRATGTLGREREEQLLGLMERLWRDMTLEEQRRVIERERGSRRRDPGGHSAVENVLHVLRSQVALGLPGCEVEGRRLTFHYRDGRGRLVTVRADVVAIDRDGTQVSLDDGS